MSYSGIGAAEEHARMIIDSYRRWTGKPLLDAEEEAVAAEGQEQAPASDTSLGAFERLFHAPLVLLSHGTEADPILNFGNRAALDLWEMDWPTFTSTPSRLTAEPMEREERAKFLRNVAEYGYVDNYTGVRISSTGRRFYIKQATVWNLIDQNDAIRGQAAAFRAHRYL